MSKPAIEDTIADLVSGLTPTEIQLIVVAAEEDERNDDEDYSEFKDALEDALLAGL